MLAFEHFVLLSCQYVCNISTPWWAPRDAVLLVQSLPISWRFCLICRPCSWRHRHRLPHTKLLLLINYWSYCFRDFQASIKKRKKEKTRKRPINRLKISEYIVLFYSLSPFLSIVPAALLCTRLPGLKWHPANSVFNSVQDKGRHSECSFDLLRLCLLPLMTSVPKRPERQRWEDRVKTPSGSTCLWTGLVSVHSSSCPALCKKLL